MYRSFFATNSVLIRKMLNNETLTTETPRHGVFPQFILCVSVSLWFKMVCKMFLTRTLCHEFTRID